MHYKEFPAKKSDQKKPHLVEHHCARGYGACDEKNEEIEKKRKIKGHFHNKKIKTSGKRKSFVFICFSFLCLTREGKVSRAGGEVTDPEEKKFFVLESVPFRLLGEIIVCILILFFFACRSSSPSCKQTMRSRFFILKNIFKQCKYLNLTQIFWSWFARCCPDPPS